MINKDLTTSEENVERIGREFIDYLYMLQAYNDSGWTNELTNSKTRIEEAIMWARRHLKR